MSSEVPSPFATPPLPHLDFSKQSPENLFTADYWRQLCPELHINDKEYQEKALKVLPVPPSRREDFQSRLFKEGYFDLHSNDCKSVLSMKQLAENVAKLMQYGWPPSFLVMFDELWALVAHMSQIMYETTGNRMNMDILIWFIDPNHNQKGFSPHRDRQPENPSKTFRDDGTPLYSTCWMPFTDACPSNSCLYMIPSWADPGYYEGDREDKDPLRVALPGKEAFQNIRAIPLDAGAAVIFTHRIIHWGSQGREGYHTPRIACSFAGADDSYEPSYFSREHLPYPPLELRLALLSAQMLIYYQRFSFTPKELSCFYKLYRSQKSHFCPSYVKKVEFEFVKSMKESESEGAVLDGPEDDSEDIMDDALNAVLEAKMQGFDDFSDDFDDLDMEDIEPLEGAEEEEWSEEEELVWEH